MYQIEVPSDAQGNTDNADVTVIGRRVVGGDRSVFDVGDRAAGHRRSYASQENEIVELHVFRSWY